MQRLQNAANKISELRRGLFTPNSFASNPINEIRQIHQSITSEQIEVLEDAIRQYERLEEIKKYTSIVLREIEMKNKQELELEARELEARLRRDREIDIERLLNSEDFLNDLYADGFDN